jgi:hypothetical protein
MIKGRKREKREAARRIAEVLSHNNVFGQGHPYYDRLKRGLVKMSGEELAALYMVIMCCRNIPEDITTLNFDFDE